jgi:hypothetical protein
MSPQVSDILITAALVAALFAATAFALMLCKLCVWLSLVAMRRPSISPFWSFTITELLVFCAIIGFLVAAFILPSVTVIHD